MSLQNHFAVFYVRDFFEEKDVRRPRNRETMLTPITTINAGRNLHNTFGIFYTCLPISDVILFLNFVHSRSLFSLFSSFQSNWYNIIFRIADLWCRKQPLYQVSHCPIIWWINMISPIKPSKEIPWLRSNLYKTTSSKFIFVLCLYLEKVKNESKLSCFYDSLERVKQRETPYVRLIRISFIYQQVFTLKSFLAFIIIIFLETLFVFSFVCLFYCNVT